MGIELSPDIAYLVGMITGRGYISHSNKRIIIELAHKSEYLRSIPKCPHCGGIVKVKRKDNPNRLGFCDKCGKQVKKSKYNFSFNQREEVLKFAHCFLSNLIEKRSGKKPDISGNKFITYISVDFSKNEDLFEYICKMFEPNQSYNLFEIPRCIYEGDTKIKKSFMQGVADSAGFPTWSGWIMRSEGDRARIYLQIVRNWKLAVQLCNFLQDDLNIPVQTIDWGHPNIRDPDMVEYVKKGGGTSWGREHQIKIYPEAFKEIGFKAYHKQVIFEELVKHNENINFPEQKKCFPPNKIRRKQFKVFHEGEKEKRLPPELINQHFDAYWQVCWKMGCSQIKKQLKKFRSKEYCYLTGVKDYERRQQMLVEANINTEIERIERLRKKKLKKAKIKWKGIEERKRKKEEKRKKMEGEEEKLYEPMRAWLNIFLQNKFPKAIIKTNITSRQYLSKFMSQNNLFEQFEYCEEFEIKPDIVGFIPEESKLAFIEAKIGTLALKDIGQLLGYCQVARPEWAFILSQKNPSKSLIKILTASPHLLDYGNVKNIIIGRWDKKKNIIDKKSIFPRQEWK